MIDEWKTANDWFQEGRSLNKKHEYEQAVACFTKALAIDPSLSRAYSIRADIYRFQRKYDEALSDCMTACLLTPDDYWAFVVRADVYYYLEQFDQCVASATKAIELTQSKPNPRCFAVRAKDNHKLRNYHQALADSAAALDIDETDCEALRSRARAYKALGENRAAIDSFTALIEGHPDHEAVPWALAERAFCYLEIDENSKALEDGEKAFRLDPSDSAGLRRRARAHQKLGNHKLAVEDFSLFLREFPDHWEQCWAYAGRAHSLAELCEYSEALKDVSASLKLESTGTTANWAHRIRARCLGQMKMKQLLSGDESN